MKPYPQTMARLAELEDALTKAGTEGLAPRELLARFPHWSRSTLYNVLGAGRRLGRVVMESMHPMAFYWHSAVSEAARRAAFARRLTEERELRGYAVRAGTERHLLKQGRRMKARPSCTPHPTVRAVDANALRHDAAVTRPAGLQVQICPGYRSRTERWAADSKPAPLPDEAPSAWAAAVLAARADAMKGGAT